MKIIPPTGKSCEKILSGVLSLKTTGATYQNGYSFQFKAKVMYFQ